MDAQDPPYLPHPRVLVAPCLLLGATILQYRPYLAGSRSQDVFQNSIHRPCAAAAVRLRICRHWDKPVLPDQVHRHVPLTTIPDRVTEQEVDCPVVHRSVRCLQDGLQKVIGPLQLVPEVDMRLTKLEVLHIHLLHRPNPEEIQRSEKPTPTTPPLVGDAPLIQFRAEREIHVLNQVPPKG